MAEDTPKAPVAAESPKVKLAPEIEIEFGDDRNRVFAWGPTMAVLRGAWTRKNLRSDELVEELARMPDIPGMRIRLAYDRKLAVVYDPLAMEVHKETCAEIQRMILAQFRRTEGPAKEDKRESMDQDDLKTWLYGMRRRVDAKQATVTKGDLPTLEVIAKLPGRTRMEMYNSSSRACKWREEFDQYTNAILTLARGNVPIG